MIYPISFCIAESKMLTCPPRKTKLFAHIVPGQLQTYIYGADEKAYYADYAASVFGITHLKAGWDCMRHYEILANGCVPFFKELDKCPPNTMTHFPKALVREAMAALVGTTNFETEDVLKYTAMLLDYAHKHLTTKAMASYIMSKIERRDVKSVLFISDNLGVDYMRCLLLHGFKELFGADCHDFPALPHLYTDFPVEKLNTLYGRGMSVSRLLNRQRARREEQDLTVEADIAAHKYDIIVYGSAHRGLPHWDLAHRYYASKDIVMICGEDLHNCEFRKLAVSHDLFLREQ